MDCGKKFMERVCLMFGSVKKNFIDLFSYLYTLILKLFIRREIYERFL